MRATHKSFLFFLLGVVSCNTTVDQKLDPTVFYRRDMWMTVNGKPWDGVAVVPLAPKYDFKVKTVGRNDLFTITTCHREERLRNQRDEVEFTYVPNVGVEDKPSCAMRLGGFEKDRGRHSWAFVEFEHADYKVEGTMQCNGQTIGVRGKGVCQSFAGLVQRVKFKYPVKISPSLGCPMPTPKDELNFDFEIVKGECVYEFWEPSFSRRFLLTTLGYEQILIRQE